MRPRIKLQHKLRLFGRRLPKSTAFRYEQGNDEPQVLDKRGNLQVKFCAKAETALVRFRDLSGKWN